MANIRLTQQQKGSRCLPPVVTGHVMSHEAESDFWWASWVGFLPWEADSLGWGVSRVDPQSLYHVNMGEVDRD